MIASLANGHSMRPAIRSVISPVISPYCAWMLGQEARALRTRLARVKPFALLEAMTPAAALNPAAQLAIERHLILGRRRLNGQVDDFLAWIDSPPARRVSAAEAQRRYGLLRLRFNAALTQFDLFSDVITQRSENENGVWLAGLDVLAAESLSLAGAYYRAPPLICYLDRGAGAAIRRARTRLPGGGDNPVAIIRVPRERMIGSGIASSLVHEVGHQVAALLDLVNSLRPLLQGMQRGGGNAATVWQLWERWISEIVADFWAVASVGIASTMGLIGVVSLPRPFVFRVNVDDPHPAPWLRVKLSCAIGQALYPHPQWAKLSNAWESFYPLQTLAPAQRQLFAQLLASMPAFVALLVNHRPPSLRGKSLAEILATTLRQPARLHALYRSWQRTPQQMYRAPPSLVFAVIGQGRASGAIGPEQEDQLIAKLLTHWALKGTLDSAATCGAISSTMRLNYP
jgi:hypothetical protein